jgi:hypothetical protein
MSETIRPLFRFLAVRPPQHAADDERRTLFLDAGGIGSALTAEFDGATSFASRRAAARQFIRDTDYVPGFTSTQPWVAVLRICLAVLEAVDSDAAAEAARRRVKSLRDRDPDLGSDLLDSVLRRLWDSLYAAYLSPQTDPRDRSELIALIRVASGLRNPDLLKTKQQVDRLLGSVPLVPRRWFTVRSAVDPEPAEVTADGPDGQLPPELAARLERANALRNRYFGLRDAMADVRLVERRAMYADRGRPPDRPTPAPTTAGDPSERMTVDIGDPKADNWQLPASAIEQLADGTRTLVADVGRDFSLDGTGCVLAALQDEQRQTVGRLFRVGGPAAMVDLDQAIKPELTAIDLFPPPRTPEATGSVHFDEPYAGSVGSVRPVGVGDLLTVNETLLRYEFGEVSNIENVMQSENRERVFRQLDRLQTTVTTASQTTQSSERDLQTTERFELQNQAASTIQNDQSTSLGVGTSASYGPVLQLDVNADFSTSSSTTDSKSSSTNYARDVTDRSVASLTSTVQERTVTSTLTETEETDTHGFDNSGGDGHVVGIYRWVDKRYQAQVLNYGKRLMMEFIVPEPSAFYHAAADTAGTAGVAATPPEPLPAGFSFRDITPSTYQVWTDLYRVSDVDPPPEQYKTLGKAIDLPESAHGVDLSKDYIATVKSDSMTDLPGYRAIEAWVTAHMTVNTAVPYTNRVVVGRRRFQVDLGDTYAAMEDEEGALPIAIKIFNVRTCALTVEVRYERTDATLEAWQLAVYQAVVTAYQNLQSVYDGQVAAVGVAQATSYATRSPDANRVIERDELKKNCIVLLTDQHFADAGAVTHKDTPFGFPEIRVGESMREGSYLKFVEQCFEWDQLTYVYYPYFWARKQDWLARSVAADVDPLFEAFLKAGAARVLVPVRPTWEASLIYFLETSEIWNGGEAPTIDDPQWVSIVDEMQAAQDVPVDDATPYGDPWEYTIPTTLVMLQDDATLPVFVEPGS